MENEIKFLEQIHPSDIRVFALIEGEKKEFFVNELKYGLNFAKFKTTSNCFDLKYRSDILLEISTKNGYKKEIKLNVSRILIKAKPKDFIRSEIECKIFPEFIFNIEKPKKKSFFEFIFNL